MRKFLVPILLGWVATAGAEGLKVGTAAVDITPTQFPVNLSGGFNENRAEVVHDPLHARAMVLQSGEETVALVVIDNLGGATTTLDEAKEMASSRTGIPVNRMLIAATHTHSAPGGNNTRSPEGIAYRKRFVEGIAASMVEAHANLQPGSVAAGSDDLPEEVFNRRWFLKPGKMPPNPFGEMDRVKMNPGRSPDVLDRPAGPTDPEITVLYARDAQRNPLGLLACYSLHYVGGGVRGQVSADYFGMFADLMPSRLKGGDGFVAMMANGTSGDINNIPFGVDRPPRAPWEQMRIVARKAADTVWRATQQMETFDSNPVLAMREREVALTQRRPTASQVKVAEAVLAITDPKELEELPRLAQSYARRTVSMANGGGQTTVKIQALRIGDFAICSFPFETFVETGLELKEKSPFAKTMVIGMANGKLGYLPTPEQHELGGYETWLGTSRVEEDSSVILTQHLLEMLEELKGE